jgi:hypothetical protein
MALVGQGVQRYVWHAYVPCEEHSNWGYVRDSDAGCCDSSDPREAAQWLQRQRRKSGNPDMCLLRCGRYETPPSYHDVEAQQTRDPSSVIGLNGPLLA